MEMKAFSFNTVTLNEMLSLDESLAKWFQHKDVSSLWNTQRGYPHHLSSVAFVLDIFLTRFWFSYFS